MTILQGSEIMERRIWLDEDGYFIKYNRRQFQVYGNKEPIKEKNVNKSKIGVNIIVKDTLRIDQESGLQRHVAIDRNQFPLFL